MKVKTKICLISALTAISAPAIMTTVSCSPDERQDNTISIIMNNENVGISADKAVKNEQLHLFLWPKNGHNMSENQIVIANGEMLTKGESYRWEEYKGDYYPEGTRELIIAAEKVTGDIEIKIDSWKMAAMLSLDQLPDKFNATLAKTSLPFNLPPTSQTVDISITYAKDLEFKDGGIFDIIMGGKRKAGVAKITEKTTPGEYTISFEYAFDINDDIIFCLGEKMQPAKIAYEQTIVNQDDVDITSQCTIDGGILTEGFWHNDRVEADITTTTLDPEKYNFLFNELEIILVSKDQKEHTLEKNKDYDLMVDPDDAKKAHITFFDNAIDEPSSWEDSRIGKIKFKYKMLDTIGKHSFAVTDGVSTNTYIMPTDKPFTHEFTPDLIDETKELKGIEVYRKDDEGNWQLIDAKSGEYVFNKETKTIDILQASLTNDIKVQLKLSAKDGTTFENDTWEHVAYWASTSDTDLLAEVYNLESKEQLLNQTRSVTYDSVKQNVKVIGINHDYLKYAEEGDMDGTKGKTAALTFEFVDLLKDSSKEAVKLDIGEKDTNGQNYWKFNEGFTSKGRWGHESNIRTYLKNDFASKFDSEVTPWVKTVSKRRLANADIGMSSDPVKKTKFMIFNDKYFIPSVTELNGSQGKEGSVTKFYIREGTVYEAYDDGQGHDYEWKQRAKKVNGSYADYWTCSFNIGYSLSYQAFYDAAEYIYGGSDHLGCPVSQTVNHDKCIAPCFCI